MTSNRNQPVLVTGTSSGIGLHLTQKLAGMGHTVYATARKSGDLDRLRQIENVIPIQMDVTKPDQVEEARQLVTSRGLGLYGLVNNAGVGGLGLLNTWTDEEMSQIFEVNVFGVHRVTNAFSSLLMESKGRVVNIGSQGGMISKKYYGPYTMTKHALEAYTVALNHELGPRGVWVSVVQPGGIVSEIGAKAIDGTTARFQRAQPPFLEEARQVLASFAQEDQSDEAEESETNRKPSSPEIVAVAVLDALFSAKPKLRYLVGTKWEGDRVLNALLEKLCDENDNPQHNYSRDQLVQLLDDHLARRGLDGSS